MALSPLPVPFTRSPLHGEVRVFGGGWGMWVDAGFQLERKIATKEIK